MAQIYIPPKCLDILENKNFYVNLPIIKDSKLRKRQLKDYVQAYLDDFGIYCNDDDDLFIFKWLKNLYKRSLNDTVIWDDGSQRDATCCFTSGAWLNDRPWKNEEGWVNDLDEDYIV